jgi:DNA polymerase III subunit delta'
MAKRSAVEKKEDEITTPHPRQRDDVLGHASAEQHLLGLFNAGRLPHALLITGARGIGKATLAYRLARFLLCPQETAGGLFGDALPPESLRVGNEKETFKRVAAASHSDLLVLEGEDIKVDEARKVPAFLSMTPAESDWRVVIIDSADAMNRNAANVLLKILEEPPARSILILISHNPGMLLPTIRSRCRVLRLRPLQEKDFTRVMSSLLPEVGAEERHALALLSGGSVGVARFLYTQNAEQLYRELLQRVTEPETIALHAFADRLNRKEAEPQFQTFARLLPYLIARIAASQAEAQPEVFIGEREMLHRLHSSKSMDGWMELWEKANNLLNDATHLYLDKKQVVITLLRGVAEGR